MNGNYIKIDRKIVKWEWYENVNTKVVFLHCLLMANWKDGRFEGHEIKRGSFVTSIKKLSKDLKLSQQSVRTALEHLKSTGEITIKTTNKFSIITVNNYSEYQDINTQDNIQSTNNQQTTNKQLTTIEEYKEYKEGKKERNIKRESTLKGTREKETEEIRKQIVDYLNQKCGTKFRSNSANTKKHINARLSEGYTLEDFQTVIDKKSNEWLGTDMAKYLRPETLFGNKFESYLNQKETNNQQQSFDMEAWANE